MLRVREGSQATSLMLRALVEAELRMRAAEARVLHAAPGALAGAVRVGVVVGPDHSRLDLAGDPLALVAVERPDRCPEPELGVVGEVDRLLLGVDVMIGSTGPNISSRMIRMSCVTSVSTVGAMKCPLNRGPPRPAAEPLRARAIASSTSSSDEIELLFRDHRPDRGVPLERVADLQRAGRRTTPSMKRSATSRIT